jgi:prepilin-type N-terminal cleavage/methylation domain-containing protein
MKNNKGFTLLEILLVIGIIGILSAIVIIAINPGRALARSRDLQRKVGITEINKGINQYYIDHGSYPPTITSELKGICNTGASATSTGLCGIDEVDLSMLVPTYLPSIPVDPTGVGYKVGVNSSRRIILVASLTELGPPFIAIGTTTYSLPAAIVDACAGSPAVGTTCLDGTIYVTPTLRTTPSDAGTPTPTPMQWANVNQSTGARSDSDGKANTDDLAPRGSGYAAAYYCRNTERTGGYTDWYLPAKDELNTLYVNRVAIRNFDTSSSDWPYYWSSTESDSYQAWMQYFDGSFQDYGPKSTALRVRCVRRP